MYQFSLSFTERLCDVKIYFFNNRQGDVRLNYNLKNQDYRKFDLLSDDYL